LALQAARSAAGAVASSVMPMAPALPERYIAPMAIGQSPFGDRRLPPRQFRRIPVRTLAPNLVTLLALCAGLTGIRMAFENRYGLALAAIVFAAFLDGIDGRLARLLKGTSKFGAELDSLSDFVNFGVAPGLILYFWGLHDLKSAGWIAAMAFAICAGLRLARFNVMSADPDKPAWAGNFFVGVPAPAGAIIVLLPIYAAFLGLPRSPFLTWLTLAYTLAIAALMVSRLPVFSGKRIGTRVPPEMVGPVIILLVLFVALLIAYPWIILTIGTLCYLASLPFGWVSYRSYEERAREGRAAETPAAAASPPSAASTMQLADDEERPPRLN
jgi:CDP-diacylglycerol---serine O-phosphatidyltransferase